MKLSRRRLDYRLYKSFITHGRLKSVFLILLLIMGLQSPPPATAFFDRVKHIKSELYDLNKSCAYYGNDKKELEICLKELAAAGDNEESLRADLKVFPRKIQGFHRKISVPDLNDFVISEQDMLRNPRLIDFYEKFNKTGPGREMEQEISRSGSKDRILKDREDLDKALSRLKPCLDECDWLNENFSGTYTAIPSEGILIIFDERMAVAKRCFEEYTNVFQLQVGQYLVNCKKRLEASNNYRKMREEAITALNAAVAFIGEESKKKPIEIKLVSYIDKVIVKNNTRKDLHFVITEYIDGEIVRTLVTDGSPAPGRISDSPPTWQFTPASGRIITAVNAGRTIGAENRPGRKTYLQNRCF